jgi:hypothetical protein
MKGKGKVVPVLNWVPRQEGILGEWRYSSKCSLTSAYEVNGQLHAPVALLPGKKILATHCIGGWVGPRAGLDTVVRYLMKCKRNS